MSSLPVRTRLYAAIGLIELVPLAVSKGNGAHAHRKGRNYQNHNPAFQSPNHARPGGSSLRVTERATLAERRLRKRKRDQHGQRSANKAKCFSNLQFPHLSVFPF